MTKLLKTVTAGDSQILMLDLILLLNINIIYWIW